MHHTQKRKAERLYRGRGVDVAEIDSSVELGENIEHLENLTGPLRDISKRKSGASVDVGKIPNIPDSVLDYYDDYLDLYHTLSKLIHTEQVNLVRTKHEMGRTIFSWKQKLKEAGETVDEHGHTGALGELMEYLASDLKYSASSLDHARNFYEKYPDWDAFAQTHFDVKGRGVSKSVRISGKEANWSQVLYVLYPGKGPKSQKAGSLCDYDRYGRYGCSSRVKPFKKVWHLCPTHIPHWEHRLTQLELTVGMLDEFEADEGPIYREEFRQPTESHDGEAQTTDITTGEQAIESGLKKENEWSFDRINFMWGCRKISEGCENCYIGRDFYRRILSHALKSPTKIDPFEGKAYYFNEEDALRKLDKNPDNHIIFVNGLSDTFGEFIPVEKIEHWHSIMEARPWYQFLLCTKRTGAMQVYYRTHKVPANVWVGTTIENRKALELRLPLLKSIDAKIRWISFEPLLEDVSEGLDLKGIQWAACGGETGPMFRPFNTEWAKNLKAVCERDGVSFFYEGANGRKDNDRFGGNLLDGKVEQKYPPFERYLRSDNRDEGASERKLSC